VKIIGYSDPMSTAPGEVVRFMVSTELPSYRADLVRLIQGDDRPEGPGFKEELIEVACAGEYKGQVQAIHPGSYIEVAHSDVLMPLDGISIAAWIWPTLPMGGRQTIVARFGSRPGSGYSLGIAEGGHVEFQLGTPRGLLTLRSNSPLRARQWYFVGCSYDASTGTARLVKTLETSWPLPDRHDVVQSVLETGALIQNGGLLHLGAAQGSSGADRTAVEAHFNGKIDSPRVFDRSLVPDELELLRAGQISESIRASIVAQWDFAAEPSSDKIVDTSGHGNHGKAVNAPMRAVTGHNWSGAVLDPARAADQYGAIWFHADDLDDANWQPSFELRIPATLRSGVYAARLRGSDGSEDYVPFFVRASRSRLAAPILVLMPTFTYLAYGNEHFHNVRYVDWSHATTRPLDLSPQDRYVASRSDLGPSLYDLHPDGSPACYSSRLRPILNMRPKLVSYWNGAARHFGADLYLLDWLENEGYRYDIATDEDLDQHGVELLARYSVVLTGTHPEYASSNMIQGIRQYLDTGGRLMYLGGNGFWWVTSMDQRRRHLIEVRKEDPTGVIPGLGVAAGEHYHSTTGEPGGLWRLRGQGPEKLFATGFTSQGFDRAEGYRQQPDSRNPKVSFIFEGIAPDETIGDFGLALGGAAGDEFDRVDFDLGSPPQTLVLASSGGHNEYCLNFGFVYEPSAVYATRVRADLAFYETSGGGAVFSVGSMCWCASLSHNGYANNVARITRNVLNEFLTRVPNPT
jgi:N,N-dimethylformamidase beta subunit-like protein/concanavalin A-like lectin/glucanase superfamily protein